MSSPNLNVLTLCGSVLTYSSGFLFAVEERELLSGAGSRAVLQVYTHTHGYLVFESQFHQITIRPPSLCTFLYFSIFKAVL